MTVNDAEVRHFFEEKMHEEDTSPEKHLEFMTLFLEFRNQLKLDEEINFVKDRVAILEEKINTLKKSDAEIPIRSGKTKPQQIKNELPDIRRSSAYIRFQNRGYAFSNKIPEEEEEEGEE